MTLPPTARYNEPDPGNGHNHPHMVAPAHAAKDWVKVQTAADQLGYKVHTTQPYIPLAYIPQKLPTQHSIVLT
jgi:hypothetical protein